MCGGVKCFDALALMRGGATESAARRSHVSICFSFAGAEAETSKIEVLTEETLLEMIERAFPNGLAFKDIAKYVAWWDWPVV